MAHSYTTLPTDSLCMQNDATVPLFHVCVLLPFNVWSYSIEYVFKVKPEVGENLDKYADVVAKPR